MTPPPPVMPALTPDANTVHSLRRAMLAWYRANRRDLPWRKDATPYHILVSEAMLQQTQVATVIDYYRRFLEAFATVQALAEAPEQQVLRLWQGLGYYRRARHLHAAAKVIVAEHGGVVPDTVEGLLKLPGVGRYTAGAIASIAYDRPAAILDGNVIRVLCRWFAIDQPADDPRNKERLWELAAMLVPEEFPGDFNQSLMELGATVCMARQPRCLMCPVSEHCAALKRGLTEQLPVKGRKTNVKAVTHHVAVIQRAGKLLFVKRPAEGLWSNMWQLPTAESLGEESLASWVTEQTGLAVGEVVELGRFKHQTTHRTMTFVVWRVGVTGGRLIRGAGVWRKADDVDDLPLANPQRRCLGMVVDQA